LNGVRQGKRIVGRTNTELAERKKQEKEQSKKRENMNKNREQIDRK
jgi:hypothetical protein